MNNYYITVHYGTANPCHMTLWHNGELVDEYYYDSRREGRQKTDAEYFEELKKLAGDKKITAVLIDPSAASFIETVRRGGYNVQTCLAHTANTALRAQLDRETPKSLKPTRIPGIGRCPSCKEELCMDDEKLHFCPTCGTAVEPPKEGEA